MSTPDRERREELASLQALGLLAEDERAELAALVAADPDAAADVRALAGTVAALGASVPQVDPPAALRARVLASVTSTAPAPAVDGRTRTNVAPFRRDESGRSQPAFAWLAAAASLVAALGVGAWAWQLQNRLRELDARLAAAQEEVVTLQRTLGAAQGETKLLRAQATVLAAPDVLRVDLAGQPAAPAATARAWWSRQRGMVFTAAALPPLPANRSYQVCVIADQRPPISAGVMNVADLGRDGGALQFFQTPADIPTPKIVAVTLEPEGGVPQPTGDKVLVGVTGL
jgi:anti-sigma-K factor RskA